MSVFSELVNESGVDPAVVSATLATKILADPPGPWNLQAADVLELWGDMNLRTMFAVFSGGQSPTTFTGRMAKMVRAMDEPTSLLGLNDPFDDSDYTRAMDVIRSIRSRENAVEGEVL